MPPAAPSAVRNHPHTARFGPNSAATVGAKFILYQRGLFLAANRRLHGRRNNVQQRPQSPRATAITR